MKMLRFTVIYGEDTTEQKLASELVAFIEENYRM